MRNEDVRYSERLSADDNYDEEYVYKRRGWAYTLFTGEDMRLLEEKLAKQLRNNPDRTKTFRDGSHAIEVNNKIVIVKGTYEDPSYEGVLVINAESEEDFTDVKKFIFPSITENGDVYYGNYTGITAENLFADWAERAPTWLFYQSAFQYRKTNNSRQGAVLPESFKSYGYTGKYEFRGGVYRKTGGNVSRGVNKRSRRISYSLRLVEPIEHSSDL